MISRFVIRLSLLERKHLGCTIQADKSHLKKWCFRALPPVNHPNHPLYPGQDLAESHVIILTVDSVFWAVIEMLSLSLSLKLKRRSRGRHVAVLRPSRPYSSNT